MKIFKIIGLGMMLWAISVQGSWAQSTPLTSQYYSNTYLANPAFAGYNKVFRINAVYRQQWNSIQGAPIVQSLTVDYGKSRAAVGLNINFDRVGLQRQSRVLATYAYHLPIDGADRTMHFGLSAGFMNQRLANSDIVGDINDPLAVSYNQRATYADGDFGLGYTSKRFRIEATLTNLNALLKRQELALADVGTFYSALSYKIPLSRGMNGMEVEPKFAYRGFKNIADIWDMGAQLSFEDKQVMLTGIYHSTKSTSFGLGLDYKKKYLISTFYTTQTSALTTYSNGTFEINIRGSF